METASHRKKQLAMARKGIVLTEHQPDLHKLRKDLATLTLQQGKEDNLVSSMSKKNKSNYYNPRYKKKLRKRQRHEPFQNHEAKSNEDQWRHNLTLLFQDGLKEMDFFFFQA